MKTQSPYGINATVKFPPQTLESERSKASGKASARYPHKPLGPSQKNDQSGKMQRPAMTPNTNPAGS